VHLNRFADCLTSEQDTSLYPNWFSMVGVTMLRAIMSFAEGAEAPKPIRQTTTAAVRPTKANIPTARPVIAHACFVMTSPPRGNSTKLVGALFRTVLSTSGDGSSGPESAPMGAEFSL
jgi:hypothetical protein